MFSFYCLLSFSLPKSGACVKLISENVRLVIDFCCNDDFMTPDLQIFKFSVVLGWVSDSFAQYNFTRPVLKHIGTIKSNVVFVFQSLQKLPAIVWISAILQNFLQSHRVKKNRVMQIGRVGANLIFIK